MYKGFLQKLMNVDILQLSLDYKTPNMVYKLSA
jgi:hypothetical protein